jgi:hypothetical protein
VLTVGVREVAGSNPAERLPKMAAADRP